MTPGQLVIITPAGVPLPQMELYSLAGGTTSLYVKGFNVSFLEVMMTDEMLKDDGITLGVYYGFYHETYDFMLGKTTLYRQVQCLIKPILMNDQYLYQY